MWAGEEAGLEVGGRGGGAGVWAGEEAGLEWAGEEAGLECGREWRRGWSVRERSRRRGWRWWAGTNTAHCGPPGVQGAEPLGTKPAEYQNTVFNILPYNAQANGTAEAVPKLV